jgi:hypothetical protein
MKTITVKGVECAVVSISGRGPGFDDRADACDAIEDYVIDMLDSDHSVCGLCPALDQAAQSLTGMPPGMHCSFGGGDDCVASQTADPSLEDLGWVCVSLDHYHILKLRAAPGLLDAATYKGEPS